MEENVKSIKGLDLKHFNDLDRYGRQLLNDKKYSELFELCHLSIKADINNVKPYILLGMAAYNMGAYSEGLNFYEMALAIKPDLVHGLSGKGACLEKLSRRDEALSIYNTLCNYSELGEHWRIRAYVSSFSSDNYANTKKYFHQWAKKNVDHLDNFVYKKPANGRTHPLRIGFIGGDFRRHAVDFVFRGFFENLKGVEKYLYSTSPHFDKSTEFYKANSSVWHEVSDFCDEELINLMRNDQLDVVIDLAGMTLGRRTEVLAARVAPIQICWWGYIPTCGMKALDYKFSDKDIFYNAKKFYTEKLLDIGNFVTYSPPEYSPLRSELPFHDRGIMTLVSLNNSTKINRELLSFWVSILKRFENVRIIMLSNFDVDKYAVETVNYLCDGLEVEGILDRLSFMRRMPEFEYMQMGFIGDACLDAWPQSGGVTTLHAAWMGMPTLCLENEYPASGYSAGIMRKLGADEFVFNQKAEIIKKIESLLSDPSPLEYFRANVRSKFKESPLMDYKLQADNVKKSIQMALKKYEKSTA